jgi:hypothetical protein
MLTWIGRTLLTEPLILHQPTRCLGVTRQVGLALFLDGKLDLRRTA